MGMFHRTDDMDDKRALDWIAEVLREPEWEPDTLERIAEVVEWTGRDISPRDEEIDSDEDE